jgi:maleylpyruvate isomerase
MEAAYAVQSSLGHHCSATDHAGDVGMTGSSTSSQVTVNHKTMPDQRNAGQTALDRAAWGLAAVRMATEQLGIAVAALHDTHFASPSLLPGWTKAHVIAHLARNADALVNLLTWARTGIEHPMYTSRADRDADIEESSRRLPQVLREDLSAACARLESAAERMTDSDWRSHVAHRTGGTLPAVAIPSVRLFEVWLHLTDLGVGIGLDRIPDEHLESLLEVAAYPHAERSAGMPVMARVELPGGVLRTWVLCVPGAAARAEVSGSARDVLGWLAGRQVGIGLSGELPELPPWG